MDNIETVLVRDNWISREQLAEAVEGSRENKKSLCANLIKLGFLEEEDVFSFFSRYFHIPYVNVFDYEPAPDLYGLFSEAFYREHLFFPLFRVEETVYLVMANPLNAELINVLSGQTGSDIYPVFCAPSKIMSFIDKVYGPEDRYLESRSLMNCPATVSLLPFERESERRPVNVGADIRIEDDRVKPKSTGYIAAVITDVSVSGKAAGMKTSVFLPVKINIVLKLNINGSPREIKGQVMHCTVSGRNVYFSGVRFLEPCHDMLNSIPGSPGS